VFLEVAWKFVKAVGVGEEISARAEVVEVRDDKPICRLSTEIRNAAGEAVLTGTATTFTVPIAAV
jgi:acyl dehydratase